MFDIRGRGSTVGREIVGGVTTFMAMSYIIFVQYAVLGGINKDAAPAAQEARTQLAEPQAGESGAWKSGLPTRRDFWGLGSGEWWGVLL